MVWSAGMGRRGIGVWSVQRGEVALKRFREIAAAPQDHPVRRAHMVEANEENYRFRKARRDTPEVRCQTELQHCADATLLDRPRHGVRPKVQSCLLDRL